MKRCKSCGAEWRTNFPHGRKSRSITSFIEEHFKDCRYKKKEKKTR